MDQDKLRTLAHYVCMRLTPSVFGAAQLSRALWYVDALSYLAFGKSATGATYVRQKDGPVPVGIEAVLAGLTQNGAVFETWGWGFPNTAKNLSAFTFPSLEAFSSEEIDLMYGILQDVLDGKTARFEGLDNIWQIAEIGEALPMFIALASRPAKITDEDIAWAHAVMEQNK